ncbi:MAG: type IX secretion system protein PorQ [Ignavibacteriales bacterium]|nr:hypothetical protein [Ignavibacteriaceae bacterium]MBW7872152.1 type IX secretion system protein PorQ [Ignavibacteria bacterium]MBZ0197325.1 type IX secretion system protein PorQ [Ignavibacteriaceae bacterium]MCZ2142264.1 type IX secretion system protein PorQ [Ignavibacteriales bacterium]WKZ73426.1 MAG: type IX secretion system protein PorQ [Ignavibacteriaceae bacterium]
MKRLIVSVFIIVTFSLNAQNTYEFLRVDISPRAAALAGSFTAGGGDANVIQYNPAALGQLEGSPFSANFVKHLLDINFFGVAYSKNFEGIGRFGAALRYANFGSFTEIDEFGNKGGNFGVNELALTVGYSNILAENFYYGVNLNLIHSSVASYSSSGVAFDLGLQYEIPSQLMTVGFAMSNIGGQLSTYNGVNERIPFDVSIGVSKKLEHLPVKLFLDFHRLNEDHEEFIKRFEYFSFGAEFYLSKPLSLRLGYDNKKRKELKVGNFAGLAGFNAGVGIKIDKYIFDYAFSSYGEIGGLHRIGISTEL